jgi:F-type H+-transporting ATPase subunit epsilon
MKKRTNSMNFFLLLPTEIIVEKVIDKLVVEDAFGSFSITPRHTNITTLLAKGILIISQQSNKCYIAIDGGFLVKKDKNIYISTENAIIGEDCSTLNISIEQQLKQTGQKKKIIKSNLARLEADFTQTILELKKNE